MAARVSPHWTEWLLGAAILAAVILAAVHFAEEREFIRLVEHAKPSWVLAAIALQAATYAAQGQIWRDIAAAGGQRVSLREAFELSLAKLFVDQALPSGGVSGTILMGKALERRGLSRRTVVSGAISSTAAFYLSYVGGLSFAWAILARTPESPAALSVSCGIFLAVSTALALAMLALPGRSLPHTLQFLNRSKSGQRFFALLKIADPRLVRNARLLLRYTGWQIATLVLDAATIWALLCATGGTVGVAAVIVGFMLASAVRTVGIVPGGLGTFEATLVWTLDSFGTPLAVGLTASLLFRGLSFWLPMLPGLWFSRQETGLRGSPSKQISSALLGAAH
ncbi:MAG: lysylphosphatidylglycerol synthase transmembrane domain-containing protein [Bryobacterales bacterium]